MARGYQPGGPTTGVKQSTSDTTAGVGNIVHEGELWASYATSDSDELTAKKCATANSPHVIGVQIGKDHIDARTNDTSGNPVAALGFATDVATSGAQTLVKCNSAVTKHDWLISDASGGAVKFLPTATLGTGINNSTDANIALTQPGLLPAVAANDYIRIGTEIMKVASVTNAYTFVVDTTTSRAKMGSTIAAHSAGDYVYKLGTFYIVGRAQHNGAAGDLVQCDILLDVKYVS